MDAPNHEPIEVELSRIRIDGQTQPRVEIDEDVVAEYAEDMAAGFPFPPVVVFCEGATVWLADGFHRYHAAKRAGLDRIKAMAYGGGATLARWYACGANRTHGLRRTNADKRRAVEMALSLHPEHSDRALAEHCGVSERTVWTVRHHIMTPAICGSREVRVGVDGVRRPLPPVPPPRAPQNEPRPDSPDDSSAAASPESAPQFNENEQAILARETREVRRGVEEYMAAHPRVSACQALAQVHRQMPGPRQPEVVRDEVGQEVPPELMEIWGRRQEAQDLLSALSRIRGAVRRYQDTGDLLAATVNHNSLQARLDQAYADLECLKPYAVCTSCHGLIGCRLCGGSGVLSKFRWDTCVPRETKDRLAAAGTEA